MNPPQNLESIDADLFGVSPPEHGALGHVLIVVLHCLVPASFITWMVFAPDSRRALGDAVLMSAVLAMWGAFTAESLRRFECWAWFLLMPLLVVGSIVCAGLVLTMLVRGDLPPPEAIGIGGLSVPLTASVRYLWTRRWQFWSDPPSRASRRPERRWVTAEWRAARLARIGSGEARLSRPDTFPG
jgi:hypothetical protein